jgi:hypothetical protein
VICLPRVEWTFERHTSQRPHLANIETQDAKHANLCHDVTEVLSAVCTRQLLSRFCTETNRDIPNFCNSSYSLRLIAVNRSLIRAKSSFQTAWSLGSPRTADTIRAPYAGGFEISARCNFSRWDVTTRASSVKITAPVLSPATSVSRAKATSRSRLHAYRTAPCSLQKTHRWQLPCPSPLRSGG